jgi:hypothetical protein
MYAEGIHYVPVCIRIYPAPTCAHISPFSFDNFNVMMKQELLRAREEERESSHRTRARIPRKGN